ncbi:MAG: class I SAM-dependent methyltransferase [Candidatus Binatia bacterium]
MLQHDARSQESPEGERVVPGDPSQNLIYQGHIAVHRYGHRRLPSGLRVLDLGCGEGYGSDLLAGRARFCVAIDQDPSVVRVAARKYGRPGLHFVVADAAFLPFRSDAFGAVWAVEVIEHLPEPVAGLNEAHRVLRGGGLCYLSTPNRPVSSPQGVLNPYHFREFDAGELRALLSTRFRHASVLGLYLTNFLSFRRRLLAEAMLGLQRSGVDRWMPRAVLRALSRRAFRTRLTGEEWNRKNRAEHWRPGPLGAVGTEYCLDLLGLCWK